MMKAVICHGYDIRLTLRADPIRQTQNAAKLEIHAWRRPLELDWILQSPSHGWVRTGRAKVQRNSPLAGKKWVTAIIRNWRSAIILALFKSELCSDPEDYGYRFEDCGPARSSRGMNRSCRVVEMLLRHDTLTVRSKARRNIQVTQPISDKRCRCRGKTINRDYESVGSVEKRAL